MAALHSERRSYVKTVRDWPKGTRRRGWGYLHDRILFPIAAADIGVAAIAPGRIEEVNGAWYKLYLDRKMLWTPFGTLRFHTFYMGDDDAAVHDHPWWFITFPFRSYTETVQTGLAPSVYYNSRVVRAWRFHFRSAFHRHFVHDPVRPFSTVIITGSVRNNWSFYPEGRRVLHREWTDYNREVEE